MSKQSYLTLPYLRALWANGAGEGRDGRLHFTLKPPGITRHIWPYMEAMCTFLTLVKSFCISFVRGRGLNGEAVLHTLYASGVCSRRWGDILRISKSYVDRELKRALEYKFGRPVPDPLDTVYQYWDEGAW